MCLSSGKDQFKAQPRAWVHVCESESVCTRLCLYLWQCVCVISSPKRQLHAEFLNGESFSVMTTKCRACISNLFSPLPSTFPSLIICVFYVFLLISDCMAISFLISHVSVVLTTFFRPLSFLLLPIIFLFSVMLLLSNVWITIACYCSEQNEMHLSQLNLHKHFEKKYKK